MLAITLSCNLCYNIYYISIVSGGRHRRRRHGEVLEAWFREVGEHRTAIRCRKIYIHISFVAPLAGVAEAPVFGEKSSREASPGIAETYRTDPPT